MATFTLRPNVAGAENALSNVGDGGGGADNYTCVDEAVADDITTYVYHDTQGQWIRDIYNLGAPPSGTGTINSVTFYFRIFYGDGEALVLAKPVQKSGDTITEGTQQTGTVSWSTKGQTYTTNPATSAAWTWEELGTLQAGVTLYKSNVNGWVGCTQVYIIVDFTPITTTVTPPTLALTFTTYAPTIINRTAPPVYLEVGAEKFYEERILNNKHIEQDSTQNTEILLNNSDNYLTSKSLKGEPAVLYLWGYPRPPQKVISQDLYSIGGTLTCLLTLAGIPDFLNEDKARTEFRNQSGDTNTVKTWFTGILAGSENTIQTIEEQTTGTSKLALTSNATFSAAGEVLIIDNRTIISLSFKLDKIGSPTGDVTFTIRDWSDKAILASKVLGDASTLTDTETLYTATLDTPLTVDDEVFIGCEYDSGGAEDYIRVVYSNTIVKADELMGTNGSSGWVKAYDGGGAKGNVIYQYIYQSFDVFAHCQAYDVVYDDEDSLIDTYMPKDSFTIDAGESRWSVCQKLLQYTSEEMRVENDGKVHVLIPPSVVAYTFELDTDYPFISKTVRDGLVIPNKIIVQSRPDDDTQYSGSATDATSYALLPIDSAPIQTLLESDAQATSIAEALLSRLQVAKQVGSGVIPLIFGYASCQVFDRVKIVDAREVDEKEGNLGSLTFQYKPGAITLTFSFGKVALKSIAGTRSSVMDTEQVMIISGTGGTGGVPLEYFRRVVLDLYNKDNETLAKLNEFIDTYNHLKEAHNMLQFRFWELRTGYDWHLDNYHS